MLRVVLKKAQQEATSPPVGVRLDACAQFVERARNRFEWRLPSRSANHRPNLKKLVTEFRCHVAFLEENKPDNWQGLEELWKLRREVEDLRHFRDEARRSEPMELADPGSMNPSTRMATLIDAGDVKRRCVENPPP